MPRDEQVSYVNIHDMLDAAARVRPINPAAEVLGISAEENERRRSAVADRVYGGSRSGSGRRRRFHPANGDTPESAHEYIQNIRRVNRVIRPEDFRSDLDYKIFLASKYKHHHKCEGDGCGVIFRCGNRKCTVTKCFVCLNGIRFTTQDVITARNQVNSVPTWIGVDTVRVQFNAPIQGDCLAYDEAAQWPATPPTTDYTGTFIYPDGHTETTVVADYAAAEARLSSTIADMTNRGMSIDTEAIGEWATPWVEASEFGRLHDEVEVRIGDDGQILPRD
jgi:hypothetical protein